MVSFDESSIAYRFFGSHSSPECTLKFLRGLIWKTRSFLGVEAFGVFLRVFFLVFSLSGGYLKSWKWPRKVFFIWAAFGQIDERERRWEDDERIRSLLQEQEEAKSLCNPLISLRYHSLRESYRKVSSLFITLLSAWGSECFGFLYKLFYSDYSDSPLDSAFERTWWNGAIWCDSHTDLSGVASRLSAAECIHRAAVCVHNSRDDS